MSSKKILRADLKAIARRIRQLRGFELTQGEFAEILGIGQSMVSKLERGELLPSVEMLIRMRIHSGRSIDWIVFGDDAEGGKNPGPQSKS